MPKWVSYLLPLIGILLFVYILAVTGLPEIVAALQGIDPRSLIAYPLFTLAIIVIRGIRWWYIMHTLAIDYPLWRSCYVWTIGFFASAITPGKLGDAVRSFYVSRDTSRDLGESFLTVFIDRLMDLVVILVLSMASVIIFSRAYAQISSAWAFLVAALFILAMFGLMLKRELMRALLMPFFRLLVPQRFQDRMSAGFNSFYDSLDTYLRTWRRTLNVLALTTAYWLLVFVLVYYITRTLDLEVGFFYIVLIIPIITVAESLPISISGLGTREAAVIYFFTTIGIARPDAVAFSLVYLAFGTYLTSFVGLLFWLRSPVRFTAVEAGAGAERSS